MFSSQDMEKEIRKEVDTAIAKAKVTIAFGHFLLDHFELSMLFFLLTICIFEYLQESPMPDVSELFTNVYVKGFGVEVS
jgi:hypothetical protein